MMRKAYIFLRVLGYVSGALGLILFVIGSKSLPPRPEWQATGGILLIVMFCAFVVTYVLYMVSKMRKQARSDRFTT